MKIIVTHSSPDIDAITAVWLIKRFLPGWEEAEVKFVPAGERLKGALVAHENFLVRNAKKGKVYNSIVNPASAHSENFVGSPRPVIEEIGGNEVIHVDTGGGILDHHLTADESVSAASLTWGYIKKDERSKMKDQRLERWEDKEEAIERIIKIVVDIDHFKEVFWQEPLAFYHDLSLPGILDGLKFQKPNQDNFYVDFVSECLDSILHNFENRIWAEREIAEKGQEFPTRFGKGLAVETINDSVIKLGQKMGFSIVVRKDPRKGYLRIKALPSQNQKSPASPSEAGRAKIKNQKSEIDLTLVYEKLKKMDPQASWFLHVSKKMLLNGSPKNPKMKPTVLSLNDIIEVLKSV